MRKLLRNEYSLSQGVYAEFSLWSCDEYSYSPVYPLREKDSKSVDKSNFVTDRDTPGWPGPFYKSSRQDPEAAHG
jgi:hypothetical protein